jgi:hypothetical protein
MKQLKKVQFIMKMSEFRTLDKIILFVCVSVAPKLSLSVTKMVFNFGILEKKIKVKI